LSNYSSFLSAEMDLYVNFQTASGRWSNTYEQIFYAFDRYCRQLNLENGELTQQIVDNWSAKRETETNNSCRARVWPILGFVRYLRSRGKTSATDPILPQAEKCTYIPHDFINYELEAFFYACDNLPSIPNTPKVLSRKISIPVIFRLLYSSGLRTNEVRLLRTENVDLNQGILNIRESKGETQHFVCLHDTMLDLMRKYDAAISKIHPHRQYFFPSPRNSHYNSEWITRNFRELWDKCNASYARAYDWRYPNINKIRTFLQQYSNQLLFHC